MVSRGALAAGAGQSGKHEGRLSGMEFCCGGAHHRGWVRWVLSKYVRKHILLTDRLFHLGGGVSGPMDEKTLRLRKGCP
jgi:hypothetical protein